MKSWCIKKLHTGKESISRRLGSRPLPFFYRREKDNVPQTQHMTQSHTVVALMMVVIVILLIIFAVRDNGRIESVSTWNGDSVPL